MQKPVISSLTALLLWLIAGDALAHPGSHAGLDGWVLLEHFLSSPFHMGFVTAGALLLAVGIIWSARRGR